MKPKHAVLGASSAHRYLNCAGSVQLAEGIPPQPSSVYAEEGTAAHEIAEQCVAHSKFNPVDFLGHTVTTDEGTKVVVTQNMVDAVQVYVDHCRALRKKATIFGVEQRVDLGVYLSFANVDAKAWGTADFFAVYDDTLEVVDYKHGQGVAVSPVRNEQAMFYGLGVLAKTTVRKRLDGPRIQKVKLTIVQPRAGDPRPESWTVGVGDLLDWGFETLIPGMQATLFANAALRPGDWCRWCPARVRCPELRAQSLKAAKMEFSPMPPNVQDLSDAELGLVMDKVEMMRVFMTAVQGEASSRCEAGRDIPGWKMVAKRATRKWVDEDTAANHFTQFGDTIHAQLYEPATFKSVAQVEKTMRRLGLSDEWAHAQSQLVEKKSSGSTLVSEGDPRERLAAIAPGSEFAPVAC